MDTEHLCAGRLLVANPLLPDPNFDRTVVLLLAYSPDDGALGLVLNRPSETSLTVPLPTWEELAASPAVVFVGGPVQQRTVICLARTEGPPGAGPDLADSWNAVTAEIGTLDLERDPSGLRGSLREVRFFAGYAGWAAGQLETEMAAGAWWAVDAHTDDVFCDDPGLLWKRVLRRQGGSLALVSYYPDNPIFN